MIQFYQVLGISPMRPLSCSCKNPINLKNRIFEFISLAGPAPICQMSRRDPGENPTRQDAPGCAWRANDHAALLVLSASKNLQPELRTRLFALLFYSDFC